MVVTKPQPCMNPALCQGHADPPECAEHKDEFDCSGELAGEECFDSSGTLTTFHSHRSLLIARPRIVLRSLSSPQIPSSPSPFCPQRCPVTPSYDEPPESWLELVPPMSTPPPRKDLPGFLERTGSSGDFLVRPAPNLRSMILLRSRFSSQVKKVPPSSSSLEGSLFFCSSSLEVVNEGLATKDCYRSPPQFAPVVPIPLVPSSLQTHPQSTSYLHAPHILCRQVSRSTQTPAPPHDLASEHTRYDATEPTSTPPATTADADHVAPRSMDADVFLSHPLAFSLSRTFPLDVIPPLVHIIL